MEELRVLVVEDDRIVRCVIEISLQRAGVYVRGVCNAPQAIEILQAQQFDVLITDLHLPGGHGIEVMAAARDCDNEIEIIVITGAGCLNTAITAISHGVFAYMQKPFSNTHLLEKVQAAGERRYLRRQQRLFREQIADQLYALLHEHHPKPRLMIREKSEQDLRSVGPLTIDPYRRIVHYADQQTELSNGEMKLLLYLADHRECVIGVRQIVRDVFGYECDEVEARDLVKARVHKLRRKIEFDPQVAQMLVSVRGAGYVLTTRNEPTQ